MLETVTVTGADDSVRPEDLVAVAREFPFVEFGILYGNRSGVPRFPSADWRTAVFNLDDHALGSQTLSAHLCGNHVKTFLVEEAFVYSKRCRRLQLNTGGKPHYFDVRTLRHNVREANACRNQQVIFQYDRVNTNALLACVGRHVTDSYSHLDIAALYDLSHGEGRLPDGWEKPLPNVRCGYAGGLSPENVAQQLDEISRVAGDAPFWIDAETHLRSRSLQFDDDVFDLDRVRHFLEAARPYVGKSASRTTCLK